ncbi:ribosome small subunit-dependent GTPase A [Jannaschia donghaensis]|uniref:Small ribosomal subunit biogenesis GTPase RsgA n=1 Tax=Jannaschia donghaensis TaxID=420998 RepID=A0A0M6YK64_9RHOB|nr:ribosome small subunit-dependent GTPase A [Jannaschia donghaensis]CTQ49913.1 Putative ribosome biogenesis GTPase RsgA [Jannaschia donghaensis]
MSDTPVPTGPTLPDLGWQAFFADQVAETTRAVRVMEVHRSGAQAHGPMGEVRVPPSVNATVGDWVVFDPDLPSNSTVLDRFSLIKRRAPGKGHEVQAIAANVDTVFVVTSATREFNVARLERYVALTLEAGAEAVIVITKPDLSEDVATLEAAARTISDQVAVVTLDARGPEPRDKLARWCAAGRTVVFLGSSGVGKSTLVNALSDGPEIATQPAREADHRGRHTTTHRQMHRLANGALVVDTPGMRELQLTDTAGGLAVLFADLEALAATCKFRDCAHAQEPGCAIKAALADGEIDAKRVERWQVLVAEDTFNTQSLSGRRWDEKERAEGIRDRRARLGKGG